MFNRLLIHFLILSGLCFSNILFSQNLHFNKLTISEGLSDNSVRDIIQDKRGYLWFATLNGLDRFDGKTFKNFTAIPGDTSSLKNSRIQDIIEDNSGNIWCITLDGNVSRVQPSTNDVVDLYSTILKKEVPIRNFALMPSGDFWLWGWSGCVKINYQDNQEKPTAFHFDHNQYLLNDTIHFVTEDVDKNIWVGTEKGLTKVSQNNDGNYIINNYLEGNSIRSFYQTQEGIWFGTFRNGLSFYSFKKNAFQPLPISITSAINNKAILVINSIDNNRFILGSTDAIYDLNLQKSTIRKHFHSTIRTVENIYKDSKNNYWISAQNRGIYRFNSDEEQLEYYDLNANTRSFLGDADKQIFFEDSYHNLWVGIYGGGIFLYDNDKNQFEQFTYSDSHYMGLSSNQVLSLFEDNSKNLWIGTMYGGINKVTLSQSGFFWKQPVKAPRNVFDNEIRAATTDKFGNLWVGSKGGNIFCYDKNHQIIRVLPQELSVNQQKKLFNTSVYCLYFDKNDNLWVGTKGKGIFILKNILDNNNNVELIHFDKTYNASNTHALDRVYSIKEDKFGQFWIGSHLSGLTLIQQPFSNPTFTVFTKEHSPNQLVSNFIRYLFIDNADNLWIGTSHGISILTKSQLTASRKRFLTVNNDKKVISSLSYNSVDYIFQASDASIYVATMGGGLNKLESANWKSGKFEWKHYNKNLGLSTNTIYAITEDKNQNLWISSSRGINKFNPKTQSFEIFFIKKDSGLNYFTESCVAKIGDSEVIFGHCRGFLQFNPQEILKDTTSYPIVLSKIYINGVEINPKNCDLLDESIDFEQEIHLNHKQNSIQIDFSVLDYRHPEKNQFSYKLENYDKNWSTPLTANTASYQNLPPGKYIFRLKATNSDGFEIPKELTFTIYVSPPFFKSAAGYALILITSAFLITILLMQYNRQVKAKHQIDFTEKINEKKLKYYTNISHEFKTPLTMIFNPVKDIINNKDATPEIIADASNIQKNAAYLLDLVEQILDFRKIREEKMPLAVAKISVNDFIKNIYYIFKPLADKNDIDFLLFMPNNEIHGYIDRKVTEKILYNLLSNAFKHTPSNKRIELSFNLQNDILEIQVKDEGEGMEKKALSRLFERFYRSENSSGLGLFFVKELVSLHKGKIEVDSELNCGTCFKVYLPISEANYNNDEITTAIITTPSPLPPISGFDIETESTVSAPKRDIILLIDDNDQIRNYVANKLKEDYQIFIATNGKEGFEIALKETPDIIVSDVMMPIMDGIEMTKKLRKNFNTSHIPIILLTVNSSDDKKFEGIEIGANDYITKPFDFKYLKLKIDSLVQHRRQLLAHFNQAPSLSTETLTRSEQDKEFIETVTDLIDKHITDYNFSVEFLSRKLNCSRTNFYKKMKGITSETPHEFIRTIQMKKAALLLQETDKSITDVGFMVGFNDSGYFSKSFKKHFGKTPKSYQKQFLKTENTENDEEL